MKLTTPGPRLALCVVICGSLALISINAAAHTFTFNAARLLTGNNPQGIASSDLNGDGRPDAVVANFNDNTVSVLLANVDGSYQPHIDYQVGTNPIAVAIGDMNNDGNMDVVVINNNCPTTPCTSPGSISVLLGNGDGTLQPHLDTPIGFSPNSLALGDLNGDKILDVVATNGQDNTMSFVIGNGNGTLKANRTIFTGMNPHGVVLDHFDGDSFLDAVVANTGDSNIGLLRGAAKGFHTQVTFATGLNPASLAVADFNQDGKPDIVTGNSGAASVSILINNAFFTGGFLPHVDLATTDKVFAVATGDFNNDGFLDVAAACTNSDVVSMEYGRGDSTFQFHVDVPSGSDPVALAASDVTGDGLTDLLIANDVDNSVYVLPGVAPKPATGVGTLGLQDLTTVAVGNMPNGVATGDFNNDGKIDLAIADRSDNNLLILLGNGDGTFTAQVSKPATGNKPSAVIAVDLNNDGILDLVATNATDNTVSVFLGNGDGSFQPSKPPASVDKRPVSVVAADFNSDGKQDLAIANQNGLDISVLLGNGDGTFQPQKIFTTGPASNPLWITAADFGNGKIDLATANNGSGSVAVLLGNGDGTFSLPVPYSVGSGPSCIAFGDFNGDGNKDLAVTNNLSNTVSILLGMGNGKFQSNVDYATAKGPFFVAVPAPVDVDQDRKQDLVIGASAASANRISVLLGNGDGTFQFHVDHVTTFLSQGPSEALGVADFNGDGAPDIAAANQVANTVSILLNNPVPITVPGSFNFGAQNLGTFTSQSFTFTNSGSAPLDMLAVSITGTNPGDFALSSNDCGTTLPIDGNCAPQVTFSPTDVGNRSAFLTFTDNAPSKTQLAALTGVGNGAGVGLNVNSLTFPITVVGSTSVVQTVTLTNYGNMTLTLSIKKSGTNPGDFIVSNTCNGSVLPGANCKINVQFAPKATGSRTANVVLTDNAPNSPQKISLTGVGTFLSVPVGSLTFGNQAVGTTSKPQTFSVTNTSTTTSVSVAISITGTNAGDFAQTNTCGTSIAPGSSCSISVTFTPTATGTRSAAVSIFDGSSGSTIMVPLSGTGT